MDEVLALAEIGAEVPFGLRLAQDCGGYTLRRISDRSSCSDLKLSGLHVGSNSGQVRYS